VAFGSDNKIEIEVDVDDKGVVTGFKDIGKQVDDLEDKAKRAGGAFDNFTKGLVQGIGQAVANNGLRILVDTLNAIPEAIARGSTIDDISSSFENLSKQAGVAGDVLITKFSSALGDTVPKVDLMKQANELLVGGLDPEKFELVAKSARSFAEVTGGSATDGINALTDSLLRGNDRALKNLGIVIDNNKAYQDFAKSIGTTADKLSEEGKVLATREAVLKALAENQERLGDVTDDAADKIDQLKAAFQNEKDEALRALSANENLNQALDGLARVAKEIDFNPLITGVANLASSFTSFLSNQLPNFLNGLELIKDKLDADRDYIQAYKSLESKQSIVGKIFGLDDIEEDARILAKEMKVSRDTVERITGDIDKILKNAGKEGVLGYDKAKKAIKELAEEADFLGAEIKTGVTPALIKADVELKKIVNSLNDTGEATEKTGKKTKDSTGLIDLNRVAEENRSKALKDSEKAEREREKALAESARKLEEYQKKVSDIIREDIRFEDTIIKVKDGTLTAADAQKILNGVLEDAKRDVQNASVANQSLSVAIGNVGDAANITLSGVYDLVKGYDETGDAAKEAAQKAKDFEDALLSAGAAAANTLIDSVFEGKTLKSGDYGDIAGEAANEGIKALFADIPIVGDILGNVADKSIQAIFDAFGSDSAANKARKSADAFFADAFEANRLAVIVNGKLQEVTDLVFKGDSPFGGNVDFADGTFSKMFDSLEPSARAAFSGVGSAFEELLGISADVSGQLAAVFANNIGGSLNNLQLLVESTGKSFEELQGVVVEAFLDGKLSAAQAQAQLVGIQKVAEKGIPDGIGLVKEAFDNLKAAGTEGGRALIDALQDIGFEAKELGDKTLEQVMQRLKNTAGVSSDEVERVFNALKSSGVDTLDKLTSATAQQLLPALAELENTKFPFAEAVKDARDYLELVESIPERKSTTIEARVVMSAEDRRALEQIASNNGSPGLRAQ